MITLLFAAALLAEVTQADIDAYAERSRIERPKQIVAYKKQMIQVRRDRTKSRDEKKAAVDGFEKRIAALKDETQPHYPPMLCNLDQPAVIGFGRLNTIVKVLRISDEGILCEAIGKNGTAIGVRYLVVGYDADEAEQYDGNRLRLEGVFKLHGSHTYETPLLRSTKTVRRVEWVDIEQHADKFKPRPATNR